MGIRESKNEQINTLLLIGQDECQSSPSLLSLRLCGRFILWRHLQAARGIPCSVEEACAQQLQRAKGWARVLRSSVLKLQRGPIRRLPALISFPGAAIEGATEAMEGGDGEEWDWKLWARVVEADWNVEKQCLGAKVTGHDGLGVILALLIALRLEATGLSSL